MRRSLARSVVLAPSPSNASAPSVDVNPKSLPMSSSTCQQFFSTPAFHTPEVDAASEAILLLNQRLAGLGDQDRKADPASAQRGSYGRTRRR